MTIGTAAQALPGRLKRIARAWSTEVREAGNEAKLVGAAAFLVTFVATRLVTHFLLARSGGGGLVIGSLHVHHMVFGLMLILVSGMLDLSSAAPRTRAVLFGIGSALVLDEFALLLNLADVYWAPQGRESIDAVVIFAAVLGDHRARSWLLAEGLARARAR